MRKLRSRRKLAVVFALVACPLTLAVPASLNAQNRKPIPSAPSKPPSPDSPSSSTRNYRTADQAALELSLLMSSRTRVTELERERRRLASQLAQDLEQLEELNAEIIAPMSSATKLDYKSLAQASAEIRSRSTRIKFYSPVELIDRTGEKIRFDADANHLATMLPQLSRAITRFLASPVFRVSAPNDLELRSFAAHDLERIIKLSDSINKIAKQLSRTVVASR